MSLGNAFATCVLNKSSLAVAPGCAVGRRAPRRRLLADEGASAAALIVNHVGAAAMTLAVSKCDQEHGHYNQKAQMSV